MGVFAPISGLALLLISSNFVVFSVGALNIAALLDLGNGAVFKLVPQYFPGEVGIVTGLVGAISGLGGFFLPIVLGVLKQVTGSYNWGFILLALFALAALLVDLLVFVRGPATCTPRASVSSLRPLCGHGRAPTGPQQRPAALCGRGVRCAATVEGR